MAAVSRWRANWNEQRTQGGRHPMTETEMNRDTICQAFEAWRSGRGAITDIFAPDMVWRIEGHRQRR